MHIYVFGSLCRGEMDINSDIDLLVVLSKKDERFDADRYSIYSYDKLAHNWARGAPFAWHLHTESRLIYSDDGHDYLASLGQPSRYREARSDCRRFFEVYSAASQQFNLGQEVVFELSTMFLAIRNIATCYSLHAGSNPRFGRHSAIQLGDKSLVIDPLAYDALVRARILSTRGLGDNVTDQAIATIREEEPKIRSWMTGLISEIGDP